MPNIYSNQNNILIFLPLNFTIIIMFDIIFMVHEFFCSKTQNILTKY